MIGSRGRIIGSLSRLARQFSKGFAQLCRAADNNPASCAEQHRSKHLQSVASAAQPCAVLLLLSSNSPERKRTFCFLDWHIDPHVDLIIRLNERHGALKVSARIEGSRTAKSGVADLQVGYAIEPKRAHCLPRQAMADQVPTAVCVQHGIGL